MTCVARQMHMTAREQNGCTRKSTTVGKLQCELWPVCLSERFGSKGDENEGGRKHDVEVMKSSVINKLSP